MSKFGWDKLASLKPDNFNFRLEFMCDFQFNLNIQWNSQQRFNLFMDINVDVYINILDTWLCLYKRQHIYDNPVYIICCSIATEMQLNEKPETQTWNEIGWSVQIFTNHHHEIQIYHNLKSNIFVFAMAVVDDTVVKRVWHLSVGNATGWNKQ